MKTNTLRREHLAPFIDAVQADDRSKRVESERFKRFAYGDLVARDKANLDITWLKDDSVEDIASLPAPEILVAEIQDELAALMASFAELAASINGDAQTDAGVA